jgi:hypothetical protein
MRREAVFDAHGRLGFCQRAKRMRRVTVRNGIAFIPFCDRMISIKTMLIDMMIAVSEVRPQDSHPGY